MATEVKAFRANDGTLHNTACEAAVRDLNLIINKSPCAENSPYAKIMLDWMTDQAAEIVATLNEYIEACPKPEQVAAAEVRVCSQCGHLEGEPHNFRHIAKYVPVSQAGFWTKSHPIDPETMQDVISEQVTAIIRAAATEDKPRVRVFIESLGVADLAELSHKPELFKKAYAWAHNNFFTRQPPREVEMSAAPMPETPMRGHP